MPAKVRRFFGTAKFLVEKCVDRTLVVKNMKILEQKKLRMRALGESICKSGGEEMTMQRNRPERAKAHSPGQSVAAPWVWNAIPKFSP